jgi:hypothetical protein
MTRAGLRKYASVDSIGKESLEYMETMIRGKNDPVWWIKTILDQELFPVQEQTIREFYRNKYNPKAIQYKRAIIGWGQR